MDLPVETEPQNLARHKTVASLNRGHSPSISDSDNSLPSVNSAFASTDSNCSDGDVEVMEVDDGVSVSSNSLSPSTKRKKLSTDEAVHSTTRVSVRCLIDQYKTGSARLRPAAPHAATINQYRKEFQLGEGTYGVVYKARDPRGMPVALKKVRLDHVNEGLPTTTIREIVALKELQHPYVVRLLDTSVTPGSVWLIFEFLEYDLHKFLRQHYAADQRRKIDKRPIPEYVCKAFMYQMLTAIAFMHGRRYLHRDLKPQNVLVSAKGIVKVADFGLARLVGCPVQRFTHEIVTLWYRAPEVLLGNMKTYYGTGVDVWSLACIMGEMYLLQPLFEGDCEIDQLFQIFMVLGTPTNRAWPGIEHYPSFQAIFPKWASSRLDMLFPDNMCSEARTMVADMLEYNPARRAQCQQVLASSYFDDVELALQKVHSQQW